MLKFIEAHDFHVDPAWADISLACAEEVAKAAEEQGADFIVTSDFFNRPLYATDKGGYNLARKIIKMWTRVCPVVAVEGTPSHDGRGCYGPLEDIGLVLLRPGTAYGYYRKVTGENYISAVHGSEWHDVLISILFGVPELSNREIVAQLGLPADQANAEAVKLFERYVTEFIAPQRAAFPGVPAVGVLHGVVSDSRQENSTDRIVQASDIVIRTETLELAGLDRWSLGHFHTPKEFEGVCAGYSGFTGIDDRPWGQVGFVPGMNLVEINLDYYEDTIHGEVADEWRSENKITRLPYGTPLREKIQAPLADYDPSVAYWLDSDDPLAVKPSGHPWSRVTYREPERTTARASEEAFNAAVTLPALAKLFDPAITESVLAKLTTIERMVSPQRHEAINVSVDEVEVTDSIFWPGKTMRFKPSAMPPGLTAIIGGNGTGKSSLLAFCTPYPVIVGKDTDSGRQSAIKDFFDGPSAQFKKRVTYNGQKHEHVINVKGAHTKTPRVECTLTADGVSKLDRGSWDEMFSMCEQLYGPFADYLLTTFYVQPLQGKTSSSLMTATMTDIRDLVQSIAGINRDPEKRHALDQKAAREKEIDQKRNWIEGAEENIGNVEDIDEERDKKRGELLASTKKQLAIIDAGKKAREALDNLSEDKRENDREIDRRKADADERIKLSTRIENDEKEIGKYKITADNEKAIQKVLGRQQERDSAINKNAALKNAYDSLVLAYNKELSALQSQATIYNNEKEKEYTKIKNKYDHDFISNNLKVENIKSEIKRLNKPCFYCKKLDPESVEKIESQRKEFDSIIQIMTAMIEPEKPIYKIIPESLDAPLPNHPVYFPIPEVFGTVDDTLKKLTAATEARTKIESLNKEIAIDRAALTAIEEAKYNIDDQIDETCKQAAAEVDRLTLEYTDIRSAVATLEAEIKALDDRITAVMETKTRIETERAAIATAEAELTDWTYIAGLFQANKLPAFELDQIAKTIDASATRNIEPYRNAAYSFSTTTQDIGKDGKPIDRFQIMVHNNETGQSKSFLAHSPGEKAFLNDAYVKALIRIRNNRAQRVYSPIISDEADGPIEPVLVSAYYAMQTEFYRGEERVLIVSHAPDAHNYVQNHVEIKELLS